MNPVVSGCNSGWIHLAPFVGGLLSGYEEDSLHQRLLHSQKKTLKDRAKWYRHPYYLFKVHSWVWNICKPYMIHQPFLSRFVGSPSPPIGSKNPYSYRYLGKKLIPAAFFVQVSSPLGSEKNTVPSLGRSAASIKPNQINSTLPATKSMFTPYTWKRMVGRRFISFWKGHLVRCYAC